MHYYILHNNDDVILKVIKPRYDSSSEKQKKKEKKKTVPSLAILTQSASAGSYSPPNTLLCVPCFIGLDVATL